MQFRCQSTTTHSRAAAVSHPVRKVESRISPEPSYSWANERNYAAEASRIVDGITILTVPSQTN